MHLGPVPLDPAALSFGSLRSRRVAPTWTAPSRPAPARAALSRAALTRVLLPLLVTLALVAPAGPAAAAAATAAAGEDSYVALGDSYSSGTGTRAYVDDGTSCLRSTLAYPSLLAARSGYDLNFRACSGAVIADVTSAQLGALSTSTSYVTVSVGGNDAGFADVLTTCAKPWWLGSCTKAVDRARAYIDDILPARLATLYSQIRERAPNARVIVAGYPQVFGDEDCNALTFFSGSERSKLNATADLINRRIGEVATSRGFSFADPTSRFVGHAVCAGEEWINGLSSPVVESYHPTRDGHARGYLPSVAALLPNATTTKPATGPAQLAGSQIAQTQRRYAALDADIEPRVVRAPDLSTPQARQAAHRAGVDINRWVRAQQRQR